MNTCFSVKINLQVMVILLLLVSCAVWPQEPLSVDGRPQINFTAEEQAWIDNHRKIIVGGTLDWPPLYFIDNDGNYVGLANDYVKLLANVTGLEFEHYIDDWGKIIDKFRNNEIDLLSAVYITDERRAYMAFSKPYLELLDYFFIHSNLSATKLEDLNGKVVAIPFEYAQIDYIKKYFPEIRLLLVDNLKESIDAVLEGKADMIYGSYSTLSYELQLGGIQTIVPFKSTRKLGVNTVQFASQKNEPILTSIIEKGLAAISRNQRNTIYSHWFSKLANAQQAQLVLTVQEQQWIKQNPKIRFTGDPSWLPYEAFDRDGNYIGIVSEFLKIIEKKLGIEFEIVPSSSWTESIRKIKSGEVAVISGTTDFELADGDEIDFTVSYLSSPVVFIAKRHQSFVASIDQIVDKKIAVIRDYGNVTAIIEAYPTISFIEVENIKAGLLDVSTGKVDILLATLAQASYNISELGINNVNIVGSTDLSTNLTFGVRKEFEPLIPLMNQALNSISQSEHQQILEAWGDEKFVARVDYALVVSVAVSLLFVIAVIIFWNRKLASEINLRKIAEQEANSAQLELKEQISLNQLIIDSVPMPLFYKDAQGKFLGFNRAFEQTFALNSEDLIGLTVEDLEFIPLEDRKNYRREDIDVIKYQKTLRKEVKITFADGVIHDTLYWISGFANSNNEPAGLVGNFVDISNEKENARQLKSALNTADEANKAKADFLANMSHEIRTPMNAIIGLSELALKTDLNRKQYNYIDKVNRSAELLLGIINDILDFSKIEAGKLDLEQIPFQLDNVFENLANLLSIKSEQKTLELLFDIAPDIPKSLI
ncbi:MAG: transporter substrate-binding domain-containing protein, partial [Colwellia sp.]|nr:transporter substrate-binding domain-containing protein [Colwellia sp.]